MSDGAVPESIEERLWVLESERAIRDVAHRYCDAADRRDWAMFRSVFHPDSTHRHDVVFEGRSHDFADLGRAVIDQVQESHHQIGNLMVRVAGPHATSQCYFTAHHLLAADAPAEFFPRHTPGVEEDWWVGGRYFDRLEHRDGRWGITHRIAVHDWERWEAADRRGFARSLDHIPATIA